MYLFTYCWSYRCHDHRPPSYNVKLIFADSQLPIHCFIWNTELLIISDTYKLLQVKLFLSVFLNVNDWCMVISLDEWLVCQLICGIHMVSNFTNFTLQWRHNGRDSVSNHQPHYCFLNRFSDANQRKHQSFASLAFVRRIHRWPGIPRKIGQ